MIENRVSQEKKQRLCTYASWVLSLIGFIFVLQFHLLTALIAGLLVYELAKLFYPLFAKRFPVHHAKGLAVGIVAILAFSIIFALIMGITIFVRSEGGSLPALLAKMADIIEVTRKELPQWISIYLPSTTEMLSDHLGQWLRLHANELQQIGKHTGQVLVRIVIGMVIGALVSISIRPLQSAPLAKALQDRLFMLSESFRRIVFAQVRISALNTVFSALYLALILPLFDVSLPLIKTMIVVTFIAGLLPVVGNLISNTVIFIVSLAHSPFVALSSLVYLVVIHKLEYFLNARIIGSQIHAKAWELLTAMLVMESIFGIPGVVAAPIAYAWLKDELIKQKLI